MTRREIIKYTAYVTGGALSAPLISSLLTGCAPEPAAAGTASDLFFFNDQEMAFVQEVIDLILPKTDSPSATEVGVHRMIDEIVGTVYLPEVQKGYRERLGVFQEFAGSDKVQALQKLEDPSGGAPEAAADAYRELKQQTIAYYLTTKEIGTQFLNYLPVPGPYQPCISLEETGGKAWAL